MSWFIPHYSSLFLYSKSPRVFGASGLWSRAAKPGYHQGHWGGNVTAASIGWWLMVSCWLVVGWCWLVSWAIPTLDDEPMQCGKPEQLHEESPPWGWVEWSWHPWYRLARRGCRKIAQGTRPRGPSKMRCQTVVRKVRMVCFSVGCEFPVRKRSKIIRVFLKWRNIWVFPEMEGSPQKQLNLALYYALSGQRLGSIFRNLVAAEGRWRCNRWEVAERDGIPQNGGSPRRSKTLSPNPFDGEWLFNLRPGCWRRPPRWLQPRPDFTQTWTSIH